MQSLQILIDQLTKGRNIHISILDFSGILNAPMTEINFKNKIHSKHFCEIAKSTDKGHRTCLRCKMLANTKAALGREPFCGRCLYGIYEVAFPVIKNESVGAIVYVGNTVIDKDKTVAQIKKTCRYTGVNQCELIEEIKQCEVADNSAELFQIAELVADYLKFLYENMPAKTQKMHWAVSLMKQHADEMYCTNISLKEIAVTCQKNEKYLGRLFKRETGMGFNEYCMHLRLNKAKNMLLQDDAKIIDVAFDCGFNNISYFNRMFKKKFGMSPRTYRSVN